MLAITISQDSTNSSLITKTPDNLKALWQMFLDLNTGKEIMFNEFVLPATMSFEAHTTASYVAKNDIRYLSLELSCYADDAINTKEIEETFKLFYAGLEPLFPNLYKEILSLALSEKGLYHNFSKRTLLLFQFRKDVLEVISSLPYNQSIEEYVHEISLRKSNLCANQQDGIVELFAEAKVKFHLSGRNSYYSYSRYYNTDISGVSSKANLFIKKGCLRINSIEFNKGKAYFTMPRGRLVGSYQSNLGFAGLLTAVANSSLIASTTNREYIGSYILNLSSGVSVPLTKNIYPVITDLDEKAMIDSNNVFLELSDEDAEFVNATNTVDMSLLYTKHKALCVQEEKEVRNCKAIYNASKTLKIVVREEKKKLSDDEAYKNRILRDYLSHAISMVAIPIFQKDFVIPECLQKSFVFKMASLQSAWYSIPHRKRMGLTPRDGISFNADGRPPEWKMPDIPTYIPVKANIVSAFVKEFRNKTITSTTQSRSSLFTRY